MRCNSLHQLTSLDYCPVSCPSCPYPIPGAHWKEKAYFPALPYEGRGEGGFLSTVYSVSPAANWWQGQHTMRQSHLILQYLSKERFHQKAWEDCSFITASYLASLEGSDLLAWGGIHCRPSVSKKVFGFVAAHKWDACWNLLNSIRNILKGFQAYIYWALTKVNELLAGKAEGRHSLGEKGREEDW